MQLRNVRLSSSGHECMSMIVIMILIFCKRKYAAMKQQQPQPHEKREAAASVLVLQVYCCFSGWVLNVTTVCSSQS